MARPLVLVFQELAAATATPTIPDLNTVIVGPAYQLLDYPDDAATIQLSSAYGQADQPAGGASVYIPPITGSDVVTVLSGGYPDQSPGSVVDHDSVALYLKYPRVVLASTNASVTPAIGTSVTTTAADKTLVQLVGGVVGQGFVAAGIQAGDRIILTSSAGSTETFVRTVASVGEPNSAGLVDIAAGNEVYLRLSQSLPASGWTYGAGGEIRIERELPIQQLVDPTNTYITFPEPGNDKLVLKGGISLSIAIKPVPTTVVPNPTDSTVSRTLSYSQLYLAYRALRQDLQQVLSFDSAALVTVNNIPTVTGIGKIDSRNPLAVGVSVALQNSGTAPIYAYGVPSDDAVGHASARDAMAIRRDLYCFVPLTQDINIIGSYKTEFEAMANPLDALANGVVQKFRIVVGSVPLPATTTIYEGSIDGESAQPAGASTGLYRTVRFGITSTGYTDNLNVDQVLPGDSITIGLVDPADASWQTRRGTHKIGHVNSSFVAATTPSNFEVIPGTSRWDSTAAPAGNSDVEFVITSPDGTIKARNLAQLAISNGGGTVTYTMKNPTVVGGPYTMQYVGGAAAVSVSLVGFAITVNFVTATSTHTQVAAAVNAHPVVSTLLTAVVSGAGGAIVLAGGPTDIAPIVGSCVSTILLNDLLFNRLEDASALFITNGVQAGDTIEIPVNPNDYSPTAFDGQILSYTVFSVLGEDRILISNGLDDTDASANELPHYYARNIPGVFIDNIAPNAQNYRIRRRLSKDGQVTSLTTIAQSVRSKRCTITWPDVVQVNDLRNGALPRTSSTVRTLAGNVQGFYIGCQVGGACAGLPSQQGLTNLGLNGISSLVHSQNYFSERQLTRLSDGGFFVMIQQVPGALPICIHQLTTDPTALETGELSVVKNVDFISKFFLDVLEPFIGIYNVTQATQNAIYRAVTEGADNLTSRTLDRIGPPLISGSVTSIGVSSFDASRIEVYFRGNIPKPLNTIAFHLVV
jgi:hypothetical protein